jgi:sugar lactone lactonase YvrE
MKKALLILVSLAVTLLALSAHSKGAGGKSFAKIVPTLDGAQPEGFTIGKGTTAYNGSIDGSIYKVNLRNGQGEILVPAEPDFDWESECYKLGMRFDPRSNYLFVAGCQIGNAYVFDADTGEELMKYQMTPQFESVINDIAITQDAVYFTDFAQPYIYRLPLSKNGRIPSNKDAATQIPLTGEFGVGDNLLDAFANGIVATPDGKTLIIGNSGTSKIFRVNPTTGHADEIIVDPPLEGLRVVGEDEYGPILDGTFLDGIVLKDGVLYILSTGWDTVEEDMVQVVVLDEDMLTGTRVGMISDSDMDGPASGAMHGDSLYVNNARYFNFPGCLPDPAGCTEYWITKLNIYDVE